MYLTTHSPTTRSQKSYYDANALHRNSLAASTLYRPLHCVAIVARTSPRSGLIDVYYEIEGFDLFFFAVSFSFTPPLRAFAGFAGPASRSVTFPTATHASFEAPKRKPRFTQQTVERAALTRSLCATARQINIRPASQLAVGKIASAAGWRRNKKTTNATTLVDADNSVIIWSERREGKQFSSPPQNVGLSMGSLDGDLPCPWATNLDQQPPIAVGGARTWTCVIRYNVLRFCCLAEGLVSIWPSAFTLKLLSYCRALNCDLPVYRLVVIIYKRSYKNGKAQKRVVHFSFVSPFFSFFTPQNSPQLSLQLITSSTPNPNEWNLLHVVIKK